MVKELTETDVQEIINGKFLECSEYHDGTCLEFAFNRFMIVWKNSYKYYIPIYLIPLILFKRKQLQQKPIETIQKTLKQYLCSVSFMASFVAMLLYMMCKTKNWNRKLNGINAVVSTFVASFSLMLEPSSRRQEIVQFIMPRFFETLWNLLKKYHLAKDIKNGDLFLFGIAMGTINYYYQNEVMILNNQDQEDSIKPFYLSIFKKLWGKT